MMTKEWFDTVFENELYKNDEYMNELAELARYKFIRNDRLYHKLIDDSTKNTKFYGDPFDTPKRSTEGVHRVEPKMVDMDSASAAINYSDGKTAVLNFADFCVPGGGYLVGCNAQEETLCHQSTLFNVLHRFTNSYYAKNNEDINDHYYYDRALYTPSIVFPIKNGRMIFDVITCAAPDLSDKKHTALEKCHYDLMLNRITFIRDILEENVVNTAILGAWGCGAFGNNPHMVASIMMEVFSETSIKNVIFAIPGGKNLEVFKRVLEVRNNDI